MFGTTLLPRTLEAALRDLRSDRAKARVEAARDLVRHADSARAEVVRGLEGALKDEAGEVRATASTALADIEAREALPALLAAMADGSIQVRQMVAAAIGEIAEPGDADAIEKLRQALADPAPEVRFQAVIAYPRLAPSREAACAALLKASSDKDTLVCHIALRMAEELAEQDPDKIDEPLLTRARALLLHGAPIVRVASAILLARVAPDDQRTRAVHEVLVAVALGELATPDAEDEATVIELCGEIGLDAARPGLTRRAFGRQLLLKNRFAWHARVALARMGDARACREIISELEAWDRDRRTLAVAAAGRARIKAARDRIAAMRGDADRADPHAVDEALRALSTAEAS